MDIDLLVLVVAAGGDIEQINAEVGEELGELDGLGQVPRGLAGVLHPLGRGDADEQGHGLGDNGADGLGDLDQNAGAVLERAAVVVGALVGDGAQKLGNQVAVCAVDLDHVEAGLDGADGGGLPGLDELLDLGDGHLLGVRVGGLVVADGRRTPHVLGPAALLGGSHLGLAALQVPGRLGAGLAAGVGELDAGLLALRVDVVDDALEGRDLGILPETGVLGRDAAVGENGGGLEDGERDATEGEGAQVNKVPVGHVAVIGGVGAHGRNGEAVLELKVADLERGEERGELTVLGGEGSTGGGDLGRGVEGNTRGRRGGGLLLLRGVDGHLGDDFVGVDLCVTGNGGVWKRLNRTGMDG